MALHQHLQVPLVHESLVDLGLVYLVGLELAGGLDDVAVDGLLQRLVHPGKPILPEAAGTNIFLSDTMRTRRNISGIKFRSDKKELGCVDIQLGLIHSVSVEDTETLVLVHDPADRDGGVTQDDVVSQPVSQRPSNDRQQVRADCEGLQLLLGDGGVSLG